MRLVRTDGLVLDLAPGSAIVHPLGSDAIEVVHADGTTQRHALQFVWRIEETPTRRTEMADGQ